MMKILSGKLLVASLVMAASYNVANAAAGDPVNINITGTVVASPCTVDSASPLNISLGDTIPAATLASAGSGSDFVPFQLSLKDCPASTTAATVTFSGTADAGSVDRYANTGTATNVDVELLNATDGTTLLGNGKTMVCTANVTDHTCVYPLKTRAYSPNGSVMPGTVSTVVVAAFTFQ